MRKILLYNLLQLNIRIFIGHFRFEYYVNEVTLQNKKSL